MATVTTGGTDVNKIWRKVQGALQQALQFDCEETQWIKGLKPLNVDFSLREVTVPLDINEGAGVGAIAEGGYESRASTPNIEEITLPLAELSARFSLSTRSAMLQNNPGAVIQKQMVYAARKKMQDRARDLADRFYGFKLGYLATTTTAATQSSGTYTLASMYGVSSLGSAAQIADKFRVGDYVALINSGALVANAVGKITARSTSTPSITVTWAGSVTSTSGDYVVKCNSSNTSPALADTDYNQSIVGLLDAMTSASVHGLTHDDWVAGYSSSTAGRFSGIKWIRAKQELANRGGDISTLVTLFDQGVYRDMVSLHEAGVRYSDPTSMEIIGDIKVQGKQVRQSRRVPSGMVMIYDPSAYRSVDLPMDEATTLTEAVRLQDQAGYVFPMLDLRCHAVVNRRKLAYFTNQTTS